MLSEDLKMEWVNEYLGPGLKRLRANPSKQERIKLFDLAQDDNYKEIKNVLQI